MRKSKPPSKSEPNYGDISASLFGGRALHGEKPSAIDRAAVLSEWRRIWRIVLQDLTPIQRQALIEELEAAQ